MKSNDNIPDEKVCPKCGDQLMEYFSSLGVWCCQECDLVIVEKRGQKQ